LCLKDMKNGMRCIKKKHREKRPERSLC
jgi:hypothetical protein